MKTRLMRVDDAAALDEAAQVIARGGLVAIPTETVYGLAADATDPRAVRRIFEAKGRPAINPLIVHVADRDGAALCALQWPATADQLADAFWPGPLTLVLTRSAAIPDDVTAGLDTVGLRVPDTLVTRQLIRRAGVPLAAPSANRSNRVSPTTAAHVLEQLDGLVDLVLDAGPARVGLESTILDLAHGPPHQILRPGPISAATLRETAGLEVQEFLTRPANPAPNSPGQMPIHYAPRSPAFRFEPGAPFDASRLGQRVGLLLFGTDSFNSPSVVLRRAFATPDDAASGLYAALHDCDAAALDAILVLMPKDQPEWHAVRDRLIRATRPPPAQQFHSPEHG